MRHYVFWIVVIALCWSLSRHGSGAAQIPDSFTNLQVLPRDMTRDSLLQVMRGFSFALGVRCQYCHAGGDGVSFEGVEFPSDDDPDKRIARSMMRMVQDLNQRLLLEIPERKEPAATVECKTCHRGLSRPLLLKQELRHIIERDGVESAVARYRELREERATRGTFDFGEWETNTLAEGLARDGRVRDAIAIYELNREYFPESSSITFELGRLYEQVGDTTLALERYQRTLTLSPNNERAKDALTRLSRSR